MSGTKRLCHQPSLGNRGSTKINKCLSVGFLRSFNKSVHTENLQEAGIVGSPSWKFLTTLPVWVRIRLVFKWQRSSFNRHKPYEAGSEAHRTERLRHGWIRRPQTMSPASAYFHLLAQLPSGFALFSWSLSLLDGPRQLQAYIVLIITDSTWEKSPLEKSTYLSELVLNIEVFKPLAINL